MGLDKLPEELLLIILKQLDLTSVHNLYNTGNQHLQNIISQGAVKKCRLSLSTLATVQTIKLNFFKSISRNLQDLDLSAVQDLTRTALLPAMKKMVCLRTLNVAYTNITIFDLLDIYELCPTIKDITINYNFLRQNSKSNYFSQEKLKTCQDLFANFDNVHFVGSADNLLYSNLPLNMLHKAKLKSLTYTIAQDCKMFTYYKYIEKKPLNCEKITLKILHWKDLIKFGCFVDLPDLIKDLTFEFEYIHINDSIIYTSPAFENYFKENFRYNRISVNLHIKQQIVTKSNQYIMIWNKETTKFDDIFFNNLDSNIKQLEPYIIPYSDGMSPVEVPSNWVCVIHPLIQDQQRIKEHGCKKRRVSAPNATIDYDDLFENKKSVELTIGFYDHIKQAVTVGLSSSTTFLKKLTFLQLRGGARYSREFFNILFRSSLNLATLDVDGYPISPCAPAISRSIPLSQSIKNIRITDKNIDLNTLLSSFSQCRTLENIMIIDSSKVSNDVPVVDALFKQCNNMYYLGICGTMSDTARTKKFTLLNKAKQKYNRHYLTIEVINTHAEYSYDPFVDVFRLVIKEPFDKLGSYC